MKDYSVRIRPAGAYRHQLTLLEGPFISIVQIPRYVWGSRARAERVALRWVEAERAADQAVVIVRSRVR